jgi:hypothetical protein
MKVTTLSNERQRRLAKWNDKVSPIAEWLSEKEELLSVPLSDSLDHDSAETYKNQFVVRILCIHNLKCDPCEVNEFSNGIARVVKLVPLQYLLMRSIIVSDRPACDSLNLSVVQ